MHRLRGGRVRVRFRSNLVVVTFLGECWSVRWAERKEGKKGKKRGRCFGS